MSTPILSILICSLYQRCSHLNRLLRLLTSQIVVESKGPQGIFYQILGSCFNLPIQILYLSDYGDLPIGSKRNLLLNVSSGEYISFIDDDDLVHDNYFYLVIKALESKPDCVGIEGIYTVNGLNPRTFIHSIKYKRWFEKDGIYYRPPNHLNPIKASIAKPVGFPPDKSKQEDRDYSMGLVGLLNSEVYINDPIYFYQKQSRYSPLSSD